MLIEFTVGNYRSFHEKVTLSMLATSLKDSPELDENNIFQAGKYSLLRSAAVYGPNASGKSNLVRAMMFMRQFILESATKLQAGEKINVQRFKLDVGARDKPAFFQVIFLQGGTTYRYGFEVDEKSVLSEWLYRTVKRESYLFVREGNDFYISSRFKREAPKQVQRQTRPNALFLSVLAQFNSHIAKEVLDWFREKFRGISGINDFSYFAYTLNRTEKDASFRQRVSKMLRLADVGIESVQVKTEADVPENLRILIEKFQEAALPQGQQLNEVNFKRVETYHPLFENGKRVGKETFDMGVEESDGTRKFFGLLGPFLDVLENGRVLAVDELEARLHPLLTRELVSLFSSPESNPHKAQLIFTTHDIGMLGASLLRRDQIWFMEKDLYGATKLYSLAEMKERKDAQFLKRYIEGRYGAVPYIAGLKAYIEQEMARDS